MVVVVVVVAVVAVIFGEGEMCVSVGGDGCGDGGGDDAVFDVE